jgi:hypothetical protein
MNLRIALGEGGTGAARHRRPVAAERAPHRADPIGLEIIGRG